jgi:hypothetical protein
MYHTGVGHMPLPDIELNSRWQTAKGKILIVKGFTYLLARDELYVLYRIEGSDYREGWFDTSESNNFRRFFKPVEAPTI